jgi:hypothetical protein
MDTPDCTRLQAIAQWTQREDEALLYTPDGGDVALGRGIGCYLLEGRIPARLATASLRRLNQSSPRGLSLRP